MSLEQMRRWLMSAGETKSSWSLVSSDLAAGGQLVLVVLLRNATLYKGDFSSVFSISCGQLLVHAVFVHEVNVMFSD